MADSEKQVVQPQAQVGEVEEKPLNLDTLIDNLGPPGRFIKENQNDAQALISAILADSSAVDKTNFTATVAGLIAGIDKKLQDQVNLIIHADKFQKLEGAWRGLYHLVNKTQTNEMLKIKVLNVSKKDLAKCFKKYEGVKWERSPIFEKVYQEEYGTIGGVPYGAIVGDFEFDHSPEDVLVLSGMAQVCAASHAPFISAASSKLFEFDDWQDLNDPPQLAKILGDKKYLGWKTLRESEDSRYLALTMPRFLARLPYGPKTVPVDEFYFEEDAEGADSKKYCWANSAYAMAANVTNAFTQYGWCTNIRGVEAGGLVEDLPCHAFPTADGSSDVKCPSEIAIFDTKETELSSLGLLPLCYIKNSTKSVFVSGQSLQKPKNYEGPGAAAANQSAQLSARLPYLFASCRFAHYLKCMVRDKIGKMMSRVELQKYLQTWINNYVLPNPDGAGDEMKARKPLADATVEVTENEDNPGAYNASFKLRPHFQLESVNISLSLVGLTQKK